MIKEKIVNIKLYKFLIKITLIVQSKINIFVGITILCIKITTDSKKYYISYLKKCIQKAQES